MPVPAKRRAKSKTRMGRAHKKLETANLASLVAHRYKKGAEVLKARKLARLKKKATSGKVAKETAK